jgi:hypothetical protein
MNASATIGDHQPVLRHMVMRKKSGGFPRRSWFVIACVGR